MADMMWIVLMVTVALVFYGIAIYNRLVGLKTSFENGFSQIEVELKRRHDLIPNLIETAKGYLQHERQTLESLTHARTAAMNTLTAAVKEPGDVSALMALVGAENALAGALGRLQVVVEQYPDLKADRNMMQLSAELSQTENRISSVRQAYNNAVTVYNAYKQSFPPLLIAGRSGHGQDATLLEFADHDAIREVVRALF